MQSKTRSVKLSFLCGIRPAVMDAVKDEPERLLPRGGQNLPALQKNAREFFGSKVLQFPIVRQGEPPDFGSPQRDREVPQSRHPLTQTQLSPPRSGMKNTTLRPKEENTCPQLIRSDNFDG